MQGHRRSHWPFNQTARSSPPAWSSSASPRPRAPSTPPKPWPPPPPASLSSPSAPSSPPSFVGAAINEVCAISTLAACLPTLRGDDRKSPCQNEFVLSLRVEPRSGGRREAGSPL